MKITPAPLTPEAVEYLSFMTDVDFSRTDFAGPEWRCLTAYTDEGALMGVLVAEFKTTFDAHCSYAITDRHCMTKKLMKAVFTALFTKAVRLTSLVDPTNLHAISMVRRMGFRYEGFLRMGIEGKRDALIYGMLKDECRYLMESPDHGQFTKPTEPVQAGFGATAG